MDYISVAQLKGRIKTTTSDEALADLITEASALITYKMGAEPASPMVEQFSDPGKMVWVTFRPDGITEIKDLDETNEDQAVVDPGTYVVTGRAIYKRQRVADWMTTLDVLEDRGSWPTRTQVTYAMADSPGVLAVCRGVCADLVALALNQAPGIKSEGISKTNFSYDDPGKAQKSILARLNKVTGMSPGVAR